MLPLKYWAYDLGDWKTSKNTGQLLVGPNAFWLDQNFGWATGPRCSTPMCENIPMVYSSSPNSVLIVTYRHNTMLFHQIFNFGNSSTQSFTDQSMQEWSCCVLHFKFPLISVYTVLSVCQSITFVRCRQTVGWIKMKLGMQVGLGPGHTVLDAVSYTHLTLPTNREV